MRKILLAFTVLGLLLLSGCGEPNVPKSEITKNGIQKKYDRYGNLVAKTSYKNGKKDGISKTWKYSGQTLRTSEVISYKNGKKNGPSSGYWGNGKLAYQYTYVDEKINGVVRHWWQNGNLLSVGTYKNGELIGKEKTYPSSANNTQRNKVYGQMSALEMELDSCRKKASTQYELTECARIERQIRDISAGASRMGY